MKVILPGEEVELVYLETGLPLKKEIADGTGVTSITILQYAVTLRPSLSMGASGGVAIWLRMVKSPMQDSFNGMIDGLKNRKSEA